MTTAARPHESPTSASRTAPGGPRSCVEFRHPTQVNLVRLCTYEQPNGFLVTEERVGSATVIATLGLLPGREQAAELVRRREADLVRQRFAPVTARADAR